MKKTFFKVSAIIMALILALSSCGPADDTADGTNDGAGSFLAISDETNAASAERDPSPAAAGAAALGNIFKISVPDGFTENTEADEKADSGEAEASAPGDSSYASGSDEQPAAETDTDASDLSDLQAASEETQPVYRNAAEQYLASETSATQVCFAIGNDSACGADFYYYEKSGGVWNEIFETDAQIGANGFNDHTIEGDRTTPTGRFPLGLAFGIRSDPGTALEWADVNTYLYWIDDINSDYYNTLIDIRETPDGWNSGEHLIEHTIAYAYSINIEVNPSCRKDSTSAIFLHCYGNYDYTEGCVAIPESCMVTLLQRLLPGSVIVIAKSEEQLLAMR